MSAFLSFLEVAKKDAEAAKCLLSKRNYPNAVYHLQQAVEKGVKSFGMWINVLTEEECRDKKIAGHDAFRIFSLFIERGVKKIKRELQSIRDKTPEIEKTSLWEKLQKQLLELDEESINIKDEMNSIEREAMNIAFSEEKLLEIANKINRFRGGKLPRGLLKFGGIPIRNYVELYRMLTQNLGKIKQLSLIDIRKIKDLTNTFFKLIYSVACLFYLSLIMSPHATKSRYPEKDWNPIKEYGERMALVRRLNFFINAVIEALNNLSEIYKKAPSIEAIFNV